uniref:Uncharacterized protein n=1 Tax=Rhizophora mucronata TaxID=61149 RepID=A0A2P2IY89_RHIMU
MLGCILELFAVSLCNMRILRLKHRDIFLISATSSLCL